VKEVLFSPCVLFVEHAGAAAELVVAVAGLAELYVEAINNGAVPTITTAWQGVAEAECRRATETGEEAYRREYESAEVTPEEVPLQAAHARALAAAERAFADTAVGDAEVSSPPRCGREKGAEVSERQPAWPQRR
jgi:hypothetical protein